MSRIIIRRSHCGCKMMKELGELQDQRELPPARMNLHNILQSTINTVTVLSQCALCLAPADCSDHLRRENPTWYPSLNPSPPSLLFSSLHGCSFRLLLSIAFYLGRHYRYLVSCLTAGAKRCVGLVPSSRSSSILLLSPP